jgi:ABC-type Fe3+/spermidine/putrescine transport system ATPase subunit
VALARAIVVAPDVLLLDEPLSNLDARLRVEMRREILRIHRQTGITTIYVTHDQKEALSMGQRIAILDRGEIAQVGRPDECYRRPRTRFVAHFLGEANFVEGKLARVLGDNTYEVTTAVGQLTIKDEGGKKPWIGQDVCCCFRPESLRVVGESESAMMNGFTARVIHTTYLGDTLEYVLSAANGSMSLLATVMGSSQPAPEGNEIVVAVAPEDIVLL